MSKYEPLNQFLGQLRADYWRPTFLELERILDFKLPAASRKSMAWWERESGASRHAQAWTDAGWKVEGVDFDKERVTFVRNGAAAAEDQAEHGNEARFAERLREGAEDLTDWMDRTRGRARETVEQHPFAVAGVSAGAAFAAGIGLGYLLYRSLSGPASGAAAVAEDRARQAVSLLADHVHDLADAVSDRVRHLRG